MTSKRQKNTLRVDTLTDRESRILNSIVDNFVKSALPVGSRVIAKKSGMSLSPATIRNVMVDLEENGYLTHTHTSSGRVPTDKGYRYFVDSITEREKLSAHEKRTILDELARVSKEVDSLLDAASLVLARVSNQLGVILSPRFFQGIFDKIELVPISENKVLMVLTIRSGLVRTIMMTMDTEVSRDVLEKSASIINERLNGLSLTEIKKTLDDRMQDVGDSNSDIVRIVVQKALPYIDQDTHRTFHFGGTNNIMVQPEFSDHQKFSNVLNLLESKEIVIHVFDQNDSSDDLSISIGEENHAELIKYCSLITTSYHLGNVSGTLGILGPTRMRYSKIITLVDYMSKVLTQALEENIGGKSFSN